MYNALLIMGGERNERREAALFEKRIRSAVGNDALSGDDGALERVAEELVEAYKNEKENKKGNERDT